MKDMILFDMDGTLTPARKKITLDVVRSLNKLSKIADIGIVTGSGLDYVKEQCFMLWDTITSDPSRIELLPCNGTKRFKWDNNNWSEVASVDMQQRLGDKYQKLIRMLLYEQSLLPHNELSDVNLSGTFFQYRDSMLNWCLIGRDSDDTARAHFRLADSQGNIRERLREKVLNSLSTAGIDDIQLSLGGHTSIDVYPVGWDKTFALKYFPDRTVWFVGDSCTGSGNDRTIYEALNKFGTAYATTGPEQTIKIIDQISKKLKAKGQ